MQILLREIIFDLFQPVKSQGQIFFSDKHIADILLADEVDTKQIMFQKNCSLNFTPGSIDLEDMLVDIMRIENHFSGLETG